MIFTVYSTLEFPLIDLLTHDPSGGFEVAVGDGHDVAPHFVGSGKTDALVVLVV